MDWVTGALTILAMELIGRKHWAGWLVGLVNQGFWAYLILDKEMYGLIPLTAILTWRYTSHLMAWKKEALRRSLAKRNQVANAVTLLGVERISSQSSTRGHHES